MRIKLTNHNNSGRRNSWWKKVTSVDTAKTNGYAIGGDFLPVNKELDLSNGDILIEVRPTGSVNHSGKEGYIYIIENDELVEITHHNWLNNFLTIRDKLANLLGEVPNPFSKFSDDELLAEAKTRGLI